MIPDIRTDTDPAAPEKDETAQTAPLSCEEELALLRQEVAAENDRRLRALAEAENLKKRLVKEKEEFVKFAAEGVLADLLPVLDNLDLAIRHGQGVSGCKDVLLGVEMTRKVFLDILAQHGLEAFGQPGEPFDPNLHEAVSVEAAGDTPEGRILAVQLKGYRLRGRLLRPAKVVVSQG